MGKKKFDDLSKGLKGQYTFLNTFLKLKYNYIISPNLLSLSNPPPCNSYSLLLKLMASISFILFSIILIEETWDRVQQALEILSKFQKHQLA